MPIQWYKSQMVPVVGARTRKTGAKWTPLLIPVSNISLAQNCVINTLFINFKLYVINTQFINKGITIVFINICWVTLHCHSTPLITYFASITALSVNHAYKAQMVLIFLTLTTLNCYEVSQNILTLWSVSQVDENNSGTTTNVVSPTQAIPCLLMPWRL